MKKYLVLISFIILGFNLVTYLLFFNGIDVVPDETFFPVMIGGSMIGIFLSLCGERGITRKITMFGNTLILLFTVIGPLVVYFLLG